MTRLLDDALDLTVVGGYTSVGYRLRSRGWNDVPRMEGKVVLVTGATSGLGLAAAERFARLGAKVWLVVRDAVRGAGARARILEQVEGAEVHVGACDLSSLGSVRGFAQALTNETSRVHVLVHNASVLTQRRELSPDGIELTLATNVIGPFLLTKLLIPLLERGAPARVINVSSGGMYTQKVRLDDLQSAVGEFRGAAVYARSKRAEVVLTEMWAQVLARYRVVVHAMHPGWADTGGLQNALPAFHRLARPLLRTPEQAADTIVWLGAADEPGTSSGGFWHDRRRRATHLLPGTRETEDERRALWAQCVALTRPPQGTLEPELDPQED